MNTRKHNRKFRSFFIALVASLIFLSCGSFNGASYLSNDGIYTSEISKKSERKSRSISNNSNYYSNYFKDLVQDDVSENEIYFTDTENYSSEEVYLDENNYVESPQIPWGEKTTQTEIIIVNTRPNYMWGLSGFGFRGSPFWNNYYFNDPYRFGYGINRSPFMDPFINPYYGGHAGFWGYDPFYSPFGFYGGYGFSRYGYNRWNSWNRLYPYGTGYYGYNNKSLKGYGKDYNSTVARVKSGRGEKNYEGTKRSDKIENLNTNNRKNVEIVESTNRINPGRGLNSLRTTYLLTNQGKNILGEKATGNSLTARPIIESKSGARGNSLSTTNPSKGIKGNSQGRFTLQPYRYLGDRKSTKTTSPRSVNQISPSKRSIPKLVRQNKNSSRKYNSRRSDTKSKPVNRNYSSNQNYSKPSYRNSSPTRSFNSSGSSRSFNSAGGRPSSGGRRN
jgi:hypothetical protein